MKIKKELFLRNVAGENRLIPVGDTPGEYNGIFVLDGIGETIWKMIENGMEQNEIVSALLSEYDAPEADIKADVEAFIGKLRDLGIVE